ncbi:MAG: DUF2167 domain-containing protein [Pseudomonadota bacterium]
MLKNLAFALFLFASGAAFADAPAAASMTAEQFESSLTFQQGKISLPGNIATLNLPPSFRYLSPTDTERVLVEAWNNPPGTKSLGMIVPTGVSLLSPEGWAVVVTYDADGHVKDDDADSIKYDELLKEMQEGTEASNEERKKLGFPSMSMVGWAEKPSYDKASHKLYWAQELKTAGATGNGLNYNIRVLGREGVLVLNAVAGMDQIAKIKTEMKQVTAFSEFTSGNKYTDFNSSTDKTAEYGIAAMVAGGVAAKLGLFGKLFAFLLLFKKLVIGGVVMLGIFLSKLFGKKDDGKVNLEK